MGARWTDARHRLEAARKAARLNAKAIEEAPLFADQADRTDADAQYWKWRFAKAHAAEGNTGYGLSADMLWKDLQVWYMRQLAAELMDSMTFFFLDSKKWKGDEVQFWKDVLTGGRRIVAHWQRTVDVGCFATRLTGDLLWVHFQKVYLREAVVWPPTGWNPPLSRANLDALLRIPDPEAGSNEADGEALLTRLEAALAVTR